MRVEAAELRFVTGESNEAIYRVSIWTAPPEASHAWALDEWDVFEADDVIQVIEWARDAAMGTIFEVFVRWPDVHFDAAGRQVVHPRFTRIYGAPGDTGGAVRTEIFVFHE